MLRHKAVHMGTMPEEWQSSVVSNLSHADSAHRQAVESMLSSSAAVRGTNAEHGRQRDAVHLQFAQKIVNTKELAQQLSSRLHGLSRTRQHTEWSLQQLQTALQALANPLEACRSRLQLRQKLPKRERVFDSFQDALLKEESQLQVAKGKYSQAIADTQRILKELEKRQQDLDVDLRDKRHALTLDTLCVDKKAIVPAVLDKSYSRTGGIPVNSALPEIFGTPRNDGSVQETAGREQERIRQRNTLRNVEQAFRSEEAAQARWAETSELLESCQRLLGAAQKGTQAEMAAKLEHTEVLREELLKQSRATSAKAAELQRCLDAAGEKLTALEKPMSANVQRERIRGQRTPREATSDQVSEALHSQHTALQGKKLQLQSQAAAMQSALDELHNTNRMLLEDIADKDRALAIDRGCAGIKNVAHGAYSYGFARVGAGQRHFADTASSKLRQTTPVSVANALLAK